MPEQKKITKANRLITERRFSKALEEILPILINTQLLGENKKIAAAVAEVFIRALNYDESINYLKNLLAKAGNPAAPFVYLANFVRDHGSLKAAIKLYKIANSYELNIEIAVLLLSALEAYGQSDEALDFGLDILKKTAAVIAGVAAAQIVAAIENSNDQIINISSAESNSNNQPAPYSHEELALIDLYFHLVKLLFSLGKIPQTARVVKVLQPIRKQGGELHLTIIRNSNSYFGFIEKLLEYSIYNAANAELPKIYAIGDSHSLSVAWQKIIYQRQNHLIHTLLATGCKIWHLRDESRFFPKENFWNQAKKLPPKSDLILILGEIDCREGILFAVQKGLYSSLGQAMEELIKIYFEVIKKLLREQQLAHIYIHPVSMVLNETRFMVKAFNQMLREFFMNLDQQYQGKIIWIDIAHQFLDEDSNLKGNYKLDGTHLNPVYLKLVAEFFESINH